MQKKWYVNLESRNENIHSGTLIEVESQIDLKDHDS